MPPIAAVMQNKIIDSNHSPLPKASPASVEVMMEGILANEVSKM